MIRFILKHRQDNSYGAAYETFETVDCLVPELERMLCRGGLALGGEGYDITDLVGVEIVSATETAQPGQEPQS